MIRTWSRELACGAIVFILVTVLLRLAAGPNRDIAAAGIVVTAVAAVAGALGSWVRASRGERREQNGWRLIALGCGTWAVGRTLQLWLSHHATGHAPSAIAANAGYFAMLSLVYVGVLWLRPPRRLDTDGLKLLLDLVIAIATLTTIAWTWLVWPAFGEGRLSRLETAIVAGHALGDVVLLLTLLIVLLRTGNRPLPPVLAFLTASLSLVATADFLWTVSWADLERGTSLVTTPAWVVAFLGVGFAATSERRRTTVSPAPHLELDDSREPTWRMLFPYPLALLLLVLVALQVLADKPSADQPMVVVGGLTVIALVIMRQGLTLRESQRMTFRLSQQVDRDPLTGLINHRKLHERLDRELAHARACGHAVSVALIDVDNFKAINDRFGHQTGDHVLRVLSSLLVRTCRGTDVAARYAGDEFLLIFPGLDLPDARKVGQRLLNEIARHRDRLAPAPDADVSLSIGLAVSRDCAQSSRQLVAIADAAMYDAKAAGKNRVVIVDADTLLTESESHAGDYRGHLFPHVERALSPH